MKLWLPVLLFIITPSLLDGQTASGPAIPVSIRLTDSVACTSVKDQSQSPTCWAFGTNSLFESDLIKKYGLHLDLSEMFIARYAYIDKTKQWLATKGKTYLAGGGQFHDVIRVVNSYGMVPEEAYTGKPNGEYSHNHAKLDTAIKRFTDKLLQTGKTELIGKDLQQMNDTLDRYLGKVPASFWYRQKQFTPKTFAQALVQFGDDYIEVVSFADKPLYKKFVLEDKFNWANDSFYNLTLDDMQMLVDTSLARGWSVGWEGDVTETGFNYYQGFALLNDTIYKYDEERLLNYKNESTERDHMLHIAGLGKDEYNRKWYYIKNSWGAWLSKYKGYLFMDLNYFKLKTIILMVNKEAMPQSLKDKLGMK
jgi:bleomycin hydrolase